MNKTFFAPLLAILSLSIASASAQSISVSISATDANASESGPDTGTLLVRRMGDMNLPLTVFYRTGGTASNGVDYQSLSNSVTIPAGAATATIVITPIDDSLVEGNESVLVRVVPPLMMNVPLGGDYGIIAPDTAFVIIADNDRIQTNEPPFVRLNEPQNGEVFSAPADVVLRAYAQDHEDGYDLKVEFFEGTNTLGFGIFVPTLCPAPYCPFYELTWSSVPPGDYVLTAVATDSGGVSSKSDPVPIRVARTNEPPVVNIAATDPDAAEPDEDPRMERPTILNTGVFTVTRSGRTNIDLPVYYRLTGSASNGVDYASLSGRVIIPAGSWSARIEVDPIDDAFVEGTETVVATVEPPVCIAIHPPPPECYQVGPNNRATVFIRDNDPNTPSNLPPVVRITAPVDGEAFREGSDITIEAVTTDPDGYAPRVEFFANLRKIGEQEIVFVQAPPDGEPIHFSFVWTNVVTGNYTLTAKATDVEGATAFATPVRITVGEPCDGQIVLSPRATGTVLYAPEFGLYDMPVGTSIQSAYFKTTAENRGFRRGFMEFAIPHLPLVRAALLLRDGSATISAPVPPDLHELSYYPADLVVNTNDFHQPTTEWATFETDANENEEHFSIDLTSVVAQFRGRNLGLRIKLAVDPEYAATGFLGAGFQPPSIVIVPCSNVFPVVTIQAPDPYASEHVRGMNTPSNTRSGTNTALFAIHRSGPTNADLTVHYAVSGTASNGVDYLQIPDRVTIPAGHRVARITISPLDDAVAEKDETVILALRLPAFASSTNLPPYAIGEPHRAAAVLADDDRPRPICRRLSDGLFHLCLPGTNGNCFSVQASGDFINWIRLCTNVVIDGAIHYVDPDASTRPHRFYRIAPEADPPSEE